MGPVYALEPKSIVFAEGAIQKVFGISGKAEVGPGVVGRIPVDVVDVLFRMNASHVDPSKAMRPKYFAIDADLDVAPSRGSGNPASLPSAPVGEGGEQTSIRAIVV